MITSTFNTLCWAKRLEQSGYPREQAEALVGVVAKTFVFTNGELVCVVEDEQLDAAIMALENLEQLKLAS